MINMWVIYAACVAGAIGVLLMAPRGGRRLAVIGSIVGAGALGAGFLALANAAPDAAIGPGVMFYVFAFIAAGAATRVITHPRPIFAALYFILVVVATGGMFLLLQAEFMAFALLIVYAGAIIITYLFVIMLAQQAGGETADVNELAPYDATAREPVAAVSIGFVLLAALLSVMYQGTAPGRLPMTQRSDPTTLADLPAKVERALLDADLMDHDATLVAVDPHERLAFIRPSGAELDAAPAAIELPPNLVVENVERVGMSLLAQFPMSLEIAGVVLMMAMLGAVILARQPGFERGGSVAPAPGLATPAGEGC